MLFPVEVRVAAADDVWLSTAHGRDTAYVAIHQYVGAPYRAYFAAFGDVAAAAGGRPHWGKEHHFDATDLAQLYPRFDDFRRVRRDVDPGGLFSNDHLDRILGPVGAFRRRGARPAGRRARRSGATCLSRRVGCSRRHPRRRPVPVHEDASISEAFLLGRHRLRAGVLAVEGPTHPRRIASAIPTTTSRSPW